MDKYYDQSGNEIEKGNPDCVACAVSNKKYIMVGNDFLERCMIFNPVLHKNLHMHDKMRSKRFFNLHKVNDLTFDLYLKFLQTKSNYYFAAAERNRNA